jgi:hypothetical protein
MEKKAESIPEKYGYTNDEGIFDCAIDLSSDVGLEVIVLGILQLYHSFSIHK